MTPALVVLLAACSAPHSPVSDAAPPPPVMALPSATDEPGIALASAQGGEVDSAVSPEVRGVRLNNRGLAMAGQGRYAEALPLYQAGLPYLAATNSSSTIARAAILNNMGVTLVALGRLVEAQPVLTEALQLRQSSLGYFSPLTLLTQTNLSAVLARVGQLKAACDMGTAAYQGRLRAGAGPSGHPGRRGECAFDPQLRRIKESGIRRSSARLRWPTPSP